MSDDEFYAEASDPVCQVYSEEDAFTSFVQAMLALFALLSLWIKRMQEKPKRAFLTWFLDVSKQGVGACYAHILNMIISAVIAGNVRGQEGILHWFWQLTAWIVILSLVKIIICIFMWLFSSPLAYAGAVLFAPLQSNIRFELLFVMIFFPGVLNVVYFWVTDSYLKAGEKHAATHHNDEEHENIVEPDTPYFQMGEVVNGGEHSSSKGNGALV